MADYQVKTPVVLLIFNRPDLTKQVFECVRQARPTRLFVVADGARRDRPTEAETCAATRAVVKQVDWQCEVMTNFSEVNLGCKNRVSSGLDWVFSHVEAAIILEDDCIPHPTFFRFCDELLERYRDDQRVMTIAGNNFQFGRQRTDDSYYFSRYNHCWGWATWRRAWKHYDRDMKLWTTIRDQNWLQDILRNDNAVEYWRVYFQAAYADYLDSWAFRWTFSCWMQNGLSILPNVNLVSNIGFGAGATHTVDSASKFANLPVEAMDFLLQHPTFMIPDTRADTFTQKHLFTLPFRTRVKQRIKRLLRINTNSM